MDTGENSIGINFEDLQFIDEGVEEQHNVKNPNEVDDEKKGDNDDAAAKAAAEQANKLETDEEKAAKEAEDNKEDDAEAVKARESKRTTDDDGDGEESSPQLYHSLAGLLHEKGVLSSVDESSIKDINDPETLVNAIKDQIKAEEFRDLTDQQKIVLNDMRAGVEPDTASKFKEAMDKLDAITEDVMQNDKQARFDLIYQDFRSRGFDHEKAERYSNRSFETKEDKQDAQEARDNLKRTVKNNYDSIKQKEIDAKDTALKSIEEDREKLKERILKTPEVMEGVDVNEGLRHEVYDEMNKIVSTNPETGKPENALQKLQRESPVDYSHKLYYLWKVTNGFKDLGYFGRRKNTSATKNLESALRQSAHVRGGGDAGFNDDVDSRLLDIGDLILPEN